MVLIGVIITEQLWDRCLVSKWSTFVSLKVRRKPLCRKPVCPRETRGAGLVQQGSPPVDPRLAPRSFQQEDAECRRGKSGWERGNPGFRAEGVWTAFRFKPLGLKRRANVVYVLKSGTAKTTYRGLLWKWKTIPRWSLFPPGFEPGTFRVLGERDNHYTTETRHDGQTLLLLPSRFSRVRLCATPWTAAYQASLSMGFSRQEHWSGWPFPSPMHESEKWKWSRSVVSDS